jgi:hypothetical protein
MPSQLLQIIVQIILAVMRILGVWLDIDRT